MLPPLIYSSPKILVFSKQVFLCSDTILSSLSEYFPDLLYLILRFRVSAGFKQLYNEAEVEMICAELFIHDIIWNMEKPYYNAKVCQKTTSSNIENKMLSPGFHFGICWWVFLNLYLHGSFLWRFKVPNLNKEFWNINKQTILIWSLRNCIF